MGIRFETNVIKPTHDEEADNVRVNALVSVERDRVGLNKQSVMRRFEKLLDSLIESDDASVFVCVRIDNHSTR